jgi:hypothetical protein
MASKQIFLLVAVLVLRWQVSQFMEFNGIISTVNAVQPVVAYPISEYIKWKLMTGVSNAIASLAVKKYQPNGIHDHKRSQINILSEEQAIKKESQAHQHHIQWKCQKGDEIGEP